MSYETVGGAAGTSPYGHAFETNAVAEAATIPVGVEFFTTGGYYEAGDAGGALYKRVASEPSHEGKIQSADGAWWENAEYILTPQMFGAVADGVADDYAAIVAAIARGTGLSLAGDNKSGPRIFFPDARYRVSDTIEIETNVHITGNASGSGNNAHAILEFDDDVLGIEIFTSATGPSGTPGDGTIIEGLRILGGGTDTTKHGIWVHSDVSIRNVQIDGFPGNGIHIQTGNANVFTIEKVRVQNNGLNGVYLVGSDQNAGLGIQIDASNNGRWGIWDASTLGNTWVACHTAGNGQATVANNPAGSSSIVWYGGFRYGAHPDATEADYVATTPGTDPTVWVQKQAASGGATLIPDWVAAQPSGTYFSGGSFRTSNASNTSAFLGCYEEVGQAGFSFVATTLAMGGQMNGRLALQGGVVSGNAGGGLELTGSDARLVSISPTMQAIVGSLDPNLEVFRWGAIEENATANWRLRFNGNNDYVFDNRSTNTIMSMSGEFTAQQFGTTLPLPYVAFFPSFGIGSSTIRRQTNGSVAPTTNVWAKGDIVWNTSPDVGEHVGWSCTTGGTGSATPAWVSGTNYSTSSFIISSGSRYYKCTTDGGTSSTVEPSHTTGVEVIEADGFGWTDLGTATAVFTPFGRIISQQTIATNAAFSLTPGTSPTETLHTGTLTADRAVTLSTTGAYAGLSFRITRTGAGAFNLNVGTGPLKALATGTWGEFVYDGSAWYLAAYGAL